MPLRAIAPHILDVTSILSATRVQSRMRLVIVFALGSLLVVACGGGSSKQTIPPEGDCTNGATATAVVVSNQRALTPDASGTEQPFRFVDSELECRVRKTLLTLSDLPAGWSEIDDFRADYGQDRIFPDRPPGTCGVPSSRIIAGLRSAFQKKDVASKDDSSFVDDTVLVFDRGSAAEFVGTLRHNCTATPSKSLSVLEDLPALGDEVFGVHIVESPDSDFQYRLMEIYVRRGDVVERVSLSSGSQDLTLDEVTDLTHRLDSKLAPYEARLQPTPEPGASPQPTLAPEGRQSMLNSALPGIEDLPRGWVLARPDDNVDADLLNVCSVSPSFPRRQRSASRTYQGGFSRSGAFIGLLLYPTADAQSVMQRLADSSIFPSGCAGRVEDIDVTWTFERLPDLTVGDESVQWRATALHVPSATLPGDLPTVGDIRLTFVAYRRNDVVALVILRSDYRPAETSDFSREIEIRDVASFVNATDAKLRLIADGLHAE